jgi:hypothetical protein
VSTRATEPLVAFQLPCVEPFLFSPPVLGYIPPQFFECGGLSGGAGRLDGCAGASRPLGLQIGALKERLTAIPHASPFSFCLARVDERSSFSRMVQQQMSCALRSGAEQSSLATSPATAGPGEQIAAQVSVFAGQYGELQCIKTKRS